MLMCYDGCCSMAAAEFCLVLSWCLEGQCAVHSERATTVTDVHLFCSMYSMPKGYHVRHSSLVHVCYTRTTR